MVTVLCFENFRVTAVIENNINVCKYVKVSVLQFMFLNQLNYKLEHKRKSFCIKIEDNVTLKIIVLMSLKKKRNCFLLLTHLNNFYFHYIATLYLT